MRYASVPPSHTLNTKKKDKYQASGDCVRASVLSIGFEIDNHTTKSSCMYIEDLKRAYYACRVMENMNEEIDLGLSLGVANQRVESCSGSGAGAGANANLRSRIDNTKPFVRPCPLTELVWSTQNGLTIKCAGCSRCLDGPFLRPTLGHTGQQNRRTADLLPLLSNEQEKLEIKTENTDRFTLDVALPLKMQDMTQKEDLKEGCSSPFHEKMEETAENDVQDLIVKDSILENSEKGGENRGEGCEEEEEDENHESMESCNSGNLSTKRNKGWRFEEQLIIGSKRIKKQSQDYCPTVKQDSSFMNWISNMVKGVKQDHDPRPIDDDQNKRLGFQTVFQSLYSPDPKRIETNTQIDDKSINPSKEIILFDKTVSAHNPDDNLNQKALGNLWITRLFPKIPSNMNTLVAKDSSNVNTSASFGMKQFEKPVEKLTCFFCGKTGHELRDCLQINENGNVFFNKKSSNFNEIASTSGKNKILSIEKIQRIPKGMFDTIRRLRLSRTDILKWMNSCLPLTNIDGYFIRLRLAKWEEGVGEAGYYVACITDENPSKGAKKPIRVNIGGVECLVESRYISNCDFLEDELIAWWQRNLTRGQVPMDEGLTSKLEERKKLGF
ncbi:hypothetical protein LXL04_003251 [Taraxacum kok-saghyz]